MDNWQIVTNAAYNTRLFTNTVDNVCDRQTDRRQATVSAMLSTISCIIIKALAKHIDGHITMQIYYKIVTEMIKIYNCISRTYTHAHRSDLYLQTLNPQGISENVKCQLQPLDFIVSPAINENYRKNRYQMRWVWLNDTLNTLHSFQRRGRMNISTMQRKPVGPSISLSVSRWTE